MRTPRVKPIVCFVLIVGVLVIILVKNTGPAVSLNKVVLGWQLYDAKGQPQGIPDSATSPGNGAAGVVLPSGNFLLFTQ